MFEAGERISVKVEREDDDWRADDPVGTSQGVEVKREPGVGRKQAGRKKLKPDLLKCEEPNCQYSTKNRGSLYHHASVHSDERPYKCRQCKKTFKTSYTLKCHLKLHSEDTPSFQCDECDYSSRFNSYFRNHKLSHAKINSIKCEHCDYSCKSKPKLVYHLLVKHSATEPWRCDPPDCQYTTRVKKNIKQHKIKIHEWKKPFKCEECQQALKTKCQLKRHSLIHMGMKPFKCQKCRYSSVDKSNLKSHEQRKHVDEKEHKCDECGASYHSKDDLEKHELKHNDALKKFKCHLCPYSALKKKYLYGHSQSHSNKGRFKCDECDRSFDKETHLKSHRFTHSKIKNLICGECDYRTNNPANLRRHRLFIRHSVSKGSSGEKCVQCGLALHDQSDSAIHRDAHRPCFVPLPRVNDFRDVMAPLILCRVKIELNDDVVIKTENV